MTAVSTLTRCSWCELPIPGTQPGFYPHCYKCRKPLCWPQERDCGYEHFKKHHMRAREVVEVSGP